MSVPVEKQGLQHTGEWSPTRISKNALLVIERLTPGLLANRKLSRNGLPGSCPNRYRDVGI